jgi:DNA (cytosine-5)-methyltransferase 1
MLQRSQQALSKAVIDLVAEDEYVEALTNERDPELAQGNIPPRVQLVITALMYGNSALRNSLGTDVYHDFGGVFYQELISCVAVGIKIAVGVTVELNYDETRPASVNKRPSGDFMRVSKILRNTETDQIVLEGVLFRRNKYMKGILPKRLNEVCMLLPPGNERDIALVPLSHVVAKRTLTLTNAAFPAHSFREHAVKTDDGFIFWDGPLVCRWLWKGPDLTERSVPLTSERILKRLTRVFCEGILQLTPYDHFESHEEAGPAGFSQDSAKDIIRVYEQELQDLQGLDAPKAGDDNTETNLEDCSDEDIHTPDEVEFISVQQALPSRLTQDMAEHGSHQATNGSTYYLWVDTFAGAGGASEAARNAGLRVTLAVDNDPKCTNVYKHNHPGARVLCKPIDEFVLTYDGGPVDVLHISPPCQYFSPAHTKTGQHDDANIAALFAVFGLLQKLRPRMVTVEQTYGLAIRYEKVYLHALLGMFAANDYDVRAKVILFADYGSYCLRKRLILFGARYVKRCEICPSLLTILARTRSFRHSLSQHTIKMQRTDF